MDKGLQIIIIFGCILFLTYIIQNIVKGKVQLKYALIWLVFGFSLLFVSIFPNIIKWLAKEMRIIEPVNAIFAIIISFLLVLVFALTVIVSKLKRQLVTIVQKVAINHPHEHNKKDEKDN